MIAGRTGVVRAVTRRIFVLLVVLAGGVVSNAFPAHVESHRHAEPAANAATTLAVGGEVARPLALDRSALAVMPRHVVRAGAHGVESEFAGVALIDVLRAAGAPLGEALRGPNLALYVRITAADGYRVVYALAELDPKFRDDGVLLVDTRDGKPLDAAEGPFRLVAPAEKRPGRWVRQVTRIDVLKAAD
ncbi:MAG: molybdopterin-dependent oxidoreductase [Xanthomonadales bacterium]|nr:molybdopterin-dependent oxidoreductase [Xanthomonadales bacterium]